MRPQPECVVLGVRDGMVPSAKPPVRLFLGTEPAQYRAERVFVWSIERVRDPSRVYEIYLLKDLAGFDRRGWLTGFTNYRFAIPHFAAQTGRAIYNDADQIYFADPGELFDAELDDHGFLALSDRDTSVMLIDCARMASVWTLEAAQRELRKTLEAKARAVPGLWGQLDPVWHARDEEYVPGHSHLLHYTAIHMQPWQPFPRRYAYQRHPCGQVWLDLERSADAAGYQVFHATRPSAQFEKLRAQLQTHPSPRSLTTGTHNVSKDLQELITATGAQTIREYGLHTLLEKPATPCDAVVCMDVLEYVPDEDVPWVMAELFGDAKRFVYVTIAHHARPQVFPDGTRIPSRRRELSWWLRHVEAAAARHPKISWHLIWQSRTATRHDVVRTYAGGCRLQGPPRVWVLTDGRPGNTTQSVGLVEAMGWPYERKELLFTTLVHLQKCLCVVFGATRIGQDKAHSDPLTPPWPDVVITTGWRTAPVARWIRKQSGGRTRLVQLGRRGGLVADGFDAVVSCTYFRLPPHPRRIDIVAPLTRVTPMLLKQAGERWHTLFETAARPRIALLVGGTSGVYRLDETSAQHLGEGVAAFAQAVGGSIFATTSPRTGPEATAALQRGLGPHSYLHVWQPGQQDNPYLAYLALADMLVVTGDSESMLAEAVATGKPIYIYPLPIRRPNLYMRLKEWVVACAQTPRLNRRGTARPQRGWAYLCARLIERGFVLPPNDLRTLHDTLVRLDMARFFGEPLPTGSHCPRLREIDAVSGRVRALVGISDA
jgi:mitochondrial fission protein ELM1